MKFSYKVLKKLVPKIGKPAEVVEQLTMHLFESEVIDSKTLDIEILPNRYSDAASYWGLAQEIQAINGQQSGCPVIKSPKPTAIKSFEVLIKEPKLCRRMAAQYFTDVKIGPSPQWLKDALEAVGQQSINNLVDLTNYVTLETGQPLHAFDFDKLEGGVLQIRSAKDGEKVISLENKTYELNTDDLVLADAKEALDVAGIKGGQKAEIDDNTKNILLTAGNFDGVGIYKTSRKIGIVTDASTRFAHHISPELVERGIGRASELIKEVCEAKVGTLVDVYNDKHKPVILKFDIDKFNKLSGLDLKEKQALDTLKRLGFFIEGNKVTAPAIRTDIEIFEDLVEEVTRLHGYENLEVKAPHLALQSSDHEDQIQLKDNVRSILTGFGMDEVYNYSFVPEHFDEEAPQLKNPISNQLTSLRSSLVFNLDKNIQDNLRFFNRVSIFEIGKTFYKKKEAVKERLMLAIAIGDIKQVTFFELKGLVGELLNHLGLVNHFMKEEKADRLRIESDHHVLGYVYLQNKGQVSFAEIDLDSLLPLLQGELSYEPLSKYPAIMRDISLLVPQEIRFATILSLIQKTASKKLQDVDLIDFYEDKKFSKGNRSLTLRLVFLDKNKTLTDREVDQDMNKISDILINELGVDIR
jgi:phenylalanyl-tRNA synthetase beta chain